MNEQDIQNLERGGSASGRLKWYIHVCIEKIIGNNVLYKRYKLGKFMLSGEVHKWMYDSFSLKRLLEDKGFSNIKVMKYNESTIEGWEDFHLEITSRGKEYKPHCLYMEAVKL